MNPETCMLRSAESFYKRGKITLIVAKFIPGINTMAAPLAGSMKMRFGQFLRLDLAGALLYAVTYLLVGYLSRDFLAATLNGFHAAGRAMEVVVIAALIVYAVYRVVQLSQVQQVPRHATGPGAGTGRASGCGEADRVQIVDVRSHGYYESARSASGFDPHRAQQSRRRDQESSKDKDIYLYCT